MNNIIVKIAFLFIVCFIISCSENISENKISIAILGQSIIEHDPRDYFDDPLRTIVPLLKEKDVVFTNLEVAIIGGKYQCDTLKKGLFFHGTTPNVLDFLRSINVNLLSLSNNHSFDFGECGIISTIHEVESRNFTYAGTGSTINEASAPGYLNIEGLKISMISLTSTGEIEKTSINTPQKPCVNFVDVNDIIHRERVFSSIEKSKENDADLIIVYHHWHGHDEKKIEWAHELIDRGADMYISQGYPEMGGIEIYNGKPLFYNLKNFIFQTRTDIGHYGSAAWENIIATLEYEKGTFTSMKIYPIIIDEGAPGEHFFAKRGFPELAPPPKATEILKNIQELSEPYNTVVEIKNGIGIINFSNGNK